jgi:broad specificity phosphatase PhoE
MILISCEETETKSTTPTKADTETTLYYLIRHAEKDTLDPKEENPQLTDKGKKRAEKWAEIFKNIKFDAVYSTDFTRTRLTAEPSAKANNLEVILYKPNSMNIDTFKSETKGKTILIVGHSNSIPKFTNDLLDKKKYEQLDESVYGNLYIVTSIGNKASSQLLQIN